MRTVKCALLLWVITGGMLFAGVSLKLKNNAEVSGSYIKIGDVADVTGDFHASQIAKTFFGPAPRKGEVVSIKRSEIVDRLKTLGLAEGVSFSGEDSVMVYTATTNKDSKEKIVAVAQKKTVKNVSKKKSRSVNTRRSDKDNHEITYEIRELAGNAIKRYVATQIGKMVKSVNTDIRKYEGPQEYVTKVEVENLISGRTLGRGVFKLVLKDKMSGVIGYARVEAMTNAEVNVAVLAQSVRKGQALTKDSFVYRSKSYQYGMTTESIDLNKLEGMVALKALKSGTSVSMADFMPPLMIKRGDLVQVKVSGRGFSVKEMAIAAGEGRKGDTIQVVSVIGKNSYHGRIVGPKLVDMPIIGSEHN